MCIIDVFPCSPLSLCVVITWIVDVFPFLPIVLYCIGKKRMCWFLRSPSFSSPSFSSEQAHKTFSTLFFLQCVIFLLEAPISFYVLSLPCFSHYCYLLCVILCTPMCSPLFFIIIACYMWLSHEIVNVLVFELNKLTPPPNTFFCYNAWLFVPNRFFFVAVSWLQFSHCHCLLHCCTRKKRRIQCTQVRLFHQYFL